MTESERDLLAQWFEQVWNQGRREAVAELLSPDSVIHEGSLHVLGPEGFHPFFDRIHGSFSAIYLRIEDTLEDGDKVCVRWSFTGQHTGDGLGMSPAGKTLLGSRTDSSSKDGKTGTCWGCWSRSRASTNRLRTLGREFYGPDALEVGEIALDLDARYRFVHALRGAP